MAIRPGVRPRGDLRARPDAPAAGERALRRLRANKFHAFVEVVSRDRTEGSECRG